MQEQSMVCVGPEGLEEAVKLEFAFRVTLTQGERYRVYLKSGNATKSGEFKPHGECFMDLAEAKKAVGEMMIMFGGLITDPKMMIDVMLKGLAKKP